MPLGSLFLSFQSVKFWTPQLKTILADTPLVRNLENEDYMDIILTGCTTLAERFSQIDAKLVREQLKKAQKNQNKIPSELKKIISLPDLPNKISDLSAGVTTTLPAVK